MVGSWVGIEEGEAKTEVGMSIVGWVAKLVSHWRWVRVSLGVEIGSVGTFD